MWFSTFYCNLIFLHTAQAVCTHQQITVSTFSPGAASFLWRRGSPAPPGLGLPDHAWSIILARLQKWKPRAVGQSKFIQREWMLAKLLFFFKFILAVFTDHKSAGSNGSRVSNLVRNFYSHLAQSCCERWRLFLILCPAHWKCAPSIRHSWKWSYLHCIAIFGK